MKAISFSALLLAGLATLPAFADISACQSDGCMMRRNAQVIAVTNYIQTVDTCMNAESSLLSLRRLSDDRFEAECGDHAAEKKLLLRVTPQSPGMDDANFTVQEL